jgi:hypothetical protein
MVGWRTAVAVLLAAVLVVGLFVSAWLVVAVALVVVALAIAYAVRALAAGQSEWFGREEQRRDERARRGRG